MNLPAERNYNIKDSSGASKKLADVFKGKYMLLDFSSSTCGYCITRARELNQSEALQAALDSDKCSHATIVPQADLRAWNGRVGGYVAKHSYEADTARIGRLVEALGTSFAGTPTFIMIDTKGQIVGGVGHGIPTNLINQHCK